jgi:hypothetical protein
MVRVRVRVGVRVEICVAGAISVWTEFMVRVRDRVGVRVAICVAGAFSVWTECTVSTGKRQWPPERNGIGRTHARASSGRAKA